MLRLASKRVVRFAILAGGVSQLLNESNSQGVDAVREAQPAIRESAAESQPPRRKMEERVDWLMWVDADSIILNGAIPAEIFLSPSDLDNVHLVATKDHNGLNAGVIFLHVHPLTINMIIESLA
ncbi:hypothetical protein CNMCM5623_004398 [Aspergillus felis]|uniref:Galactosyl transferase GMA12/MNN10 family protein n=1 Tax=Aspergillus felis TaxID=1287682 RepID=A0A8H6VB49_9EURO|nr:hypothetical protein CNMCM5623_004398 [Aspergillus felis]KAF7184182.1 hypothetical protein CNMCM7691_004807 [Aspergillus felis]